MESGTAVTYTGYLQQYQFAQGEFLVLPGDEGDYMFESEPRNIWIAVRRYDSVVKFWKGNLKVTIENPDQYFVRIRYDGDGGPFSITATKL